MTQQAAETVLQEKVTLNEALLSISTYRNGCDFRLKLDGDKTYLEYGCYCLVNLLTDKRRLLHEYLREHGKGDIPSVLINIAPEVRAELLKRKPCEVCDGFLFKKQKKVKP